MINVPHLHRPFDLELTLPGSKSHANRALICAALAPGRTVLHGAVPCEDVERMVENLGRLGFAVRWRDRDRGIVEIGGGLPTGGGTAELDCGNAGTTLRFLLALACLVPGEWTLTGVPRLQQRPIGPLATALRALGAEVADRDGCPPVTVRGSSLRGGTVALDGSVSSQFQSALQLIAPAVPGGITLEVQNATSKPYLAMTRQVMADFGNAADAGADAGYRAAGDYVIEGDWSAAGAFLVLAELSGSRVRGTNLRIDSSQGDRTLPAQIEAMRQPGPLVVDCSDTPDQLMNLAVLAARRADGTRFVGAANLRHKECDRLAVLTSELRQVGINIDEHEHGVLVQPSPQLRAATLDPHGDHRMAMAFAILGALHDGIAIDDPGCVAKSYPDFFADLARLREHPRGVALIGMRGAGKSTLAAALGTAWQLPHFDTDTEFEREHGPIAEFVAAHGWPAFRGREQQIVAATLRPGRVVALGGGAILAPATRGLLRREAVTVFVDAALATLQHRVRASSRPALTATPGDDELERVLAARLPLYRNAADITLPPGLDLERQIGHLELALQRLCSWSSVDLS